MTTQVPLSLLIGGPAFFAYRTGDQTGITGGQWTKVQLNTEAFDTASAFDPVTNFRFTPQVAGYYQLNGNVYCLGSTTTTQAGAAIYKNGVAAAKSTPPSGVAAVSTLLFLNGTTDYVELFGLVVGTGTLSFTAATSDLINFSGALVRAS